MATTARLVELDVRASQRDHLHYIGYEGTGLLIDYARTAKSMRRSTNSQAG